MHGEAAPGSRAQGSSTSQLTLSRGTLPLMGRPPSPGQRWVSWSQTLLRQSSSWQWESKSLKPGMCVGFFSWDRGDAIAVKNLVTSQARQQLREGGDDFCQLFAISLLKLLVFERVLQGRRTWKDICRRYVAQSALYYIDSLDLVVPQLLVWWFEALWALRFISSLHASIFLSSRVFGWEWKCPWMGSCMFYIFAQHFQNQVQQVGTCRWEHIHCVYASQYYLNS